MQNKYRLYNKDTIETMKKLIAKNVKVDLILCDLPYGTLACKWDSPIDENELWQCYKNLIKDDGIICLFAMQPFTSRLIQSNLKCTGIVGYGERTLQQDS